MGTIAFKGKVTTEYRDEYTGEHLPQASVKEAILNEVKYLVRFEVWGDSGGTPGKFLAGLGQSLRASGKCWGGLEPSLERLGVILDRLGPP